MLIFSRTKRRKLIAVQDFQAKDRRCVNLVREEVVKEIEADKDGWTKVKKKDGSRGLVPSAFLKGKSSKSTILMLLTLQMPQYQRLRPTKTAGQR